MKDKILDLTNLHFEDSYLSEKELVKRLSISRKDGRLDFGFFSNLIYDPVGSDEFGKYVGFNLKFETLRQKLGFAKGEKPGDFDILLIPYSESNVYFDRTCAIEVKVVRPRRNNPKKAPNSYGITQTEGLVKDGFPLVGLIHICMTEPLKEKEKASVKYDPIPFDMDHPEKNGHFMENAIDIKYDHFSQYSAVIQMKRLLSRDIPKYIGLNTVGVNIEKDGRIITWHNYDFNNGYCAGYFNPHQKVDTVKRIEAFFKNNEAKFENALK